MVLIELYLNIYSFLCYIVAIGLSYTYLITYMHELNYSTMPFPFSPSFVFLYDLISIMCYFKH